MAGVQEKRSRMEFILSNAENHKMVNSEIGWDLGIERVILEVGLEIWNTFLYTKFELALELSRGE